MKLFDTYNGKPGSSLECLNYIYDTTMQRHEVSVWFDDGYEQHREGSATEVLGFVQLYREYLNSSDFDRLSALLSKGEDS